MRMCVSGGTATWLASGAGRDIAPVEETHDHVAAVARRRGQPRAEWQSIAGAERGFCGLRGPGIDLVPRGVAQAKAQPRHVERSGRQVHDRSLDHQHAYAVLELAAALYVLEE